jgi:site-specific DNA recombinase
LWVQVQQRLKSGAARKGEGRKTVAAPSPLAGKLFGDGEPLYVQGAAKGQKRYRYYVSRSLVKGEWKDAQRGWRLPASEIEQTVTRSARGMFSDRAAITLALEESGNESASLVSVLRSAAFQVERLDSEIERPPALAEITDRAELGDDGILLSIKLPLVLEYEKSDRLPGQLILTKLVPLRFRRRGIEMRMVIEGDLAESRIDLPVLKAVARARRWSLDLIAVGPHHWAT